MNKIELIKKTNCKCGSRLKLVEYRCCNDIFKYWHCNNCGLDEDVEFVLKDTKKKERLICQN